MLIHPHRQATTTPRVRAAIQAGSEPAPLPAGRFGITGQTVRKWRNRDSVGDGSHTPHRLQTTPTPSQEAVAVALRQTLPVWPDDLPAVVREFPNPNAGAPGWTAACVGMAWGTCATSGPGHRSRGTAASVPMGTAPSTSM